MLIYSGFPETKLWNSDNYSSTVFMTLICFQATYIIMHVQCDIGTALLKITKMLEFFNLIRPFFVEQESTNQIKQTLYASDI